MHLHGLQKLNQKTNFVIQLTGNDNKKVGYKINIELLKKELLNLEEMLLMPEIRTSEADDISSGHTYSLVVLSKRVTIVQ